MPGFSVTPAGPFPPPDNEFPPTSVQFQQDGVNLGEPNAVNLNFVAPLVATRGTGENSGTISVVNEGESGDYIAQLGLSGNVLSPSNEVLLSPLVHWDGTKFVFDSSGTWLVLFMPHILPGALASAGSNGYTSLLFPGVGVVGDPKIAVQAITVNDILPPASIWFILTVIGGDTTVINTSYHPNAGSDLSDGTVAGTILLRRVAVGA